MVDLKVFHGRDGKVWDVLGIAAQHVLKGGQNVELCVGPRVDAVGVPLIVARRFDTNVLLGSDSQELSVHSFKFHCSKGLAGRHEFGGIVFPLGSGGRENDRVCVRVKESASSGSKVLERGLHEHLGVTKHVCTEIGAHVEMCQVVMVATFLECGPKDSPVATRYLLDSSVLIGARVRNKVDYVIRVPREHDLRPLQLHVVPAKQSVEEEFRDGACILGLSHADLVAVGPACCQPFICFVFLFCEEAHVARVGLPSVTCEATVVEMYFDTMGVCHSHVWGYVVLFSEDDWRHGAPAALCHLDEEEWEWQR
mmetsp:Transcript_76923/g.148603  ORF Transcript_76923/g.148603 Transcript_76923/m.148603 type:complete len:310 (-) Transcript_76923:1392-2321(-)